MRHIRLAIGCLVVAGCLSLAGLPAAAEGPPVPQAKQAACSSPSEMFDAIAAFMLATNQRGTLTGAHIDGHRVFVLVIHGSDVAYTYHFEQECFDRMERSAPAPPAPALPEGAAT